MGRKGKNLWTDRQGGAKIALRVCEDQNGEAFYLCDKINGMVASGKYKYRDCAVLYRTNAQSNIIERTFAKSAIPYRMIGGQRFNDRKEIRDVVAYLQFIVNPADSERMKRIINEPRRGIGPQTVEGVILIAAQTGKSVTEVLQSADEYLALSKAAKRLKEFAALMAQLRALLYSDISLEAFVNTVLDRSGYRQMLKDAGEEEKDRLENIEEFISGIIDYEKNNENPTLVGFLEENALVSDVDKYDEDADAVVMMTIHSAKGLEFPVVFLPGMEDGLFPGMQSITGGDGELEEERRLAYVAITRAKDQLYISHVKDRLLYGRTSQNPVSRFVKEIPEKLIENDLPYISRAQYTPRTYIENSQVKPKTLPKGDLTLKEGDRVYHATFKEGEIMSVTPMGGDVLYEVTFDNFGTKKLMGTFARLKKLS